MGHSAADTTITSPAGTNMAIATIAPITAKSVEASEKSPKKPTLTWREKLQKVFNNITVEPILAAYIMPSVLSGLATQNLNLEKACRVNMNYGEVVCDALTRRDTANYTL